LLKLKIKYNAPVTLTFAFISVLVLFIDPVFDRKLTLTWFSVPGWGAMDFSSPFQYIRLLTHAAGHANWNHLVSNFTFILLLGPILEEKYRRFPFFLMLIVTASVTGIINIMLSPLPLLGASGIVFMMIILISITNIREGEIPLTFILIVILFLLKEFIYSPEDGISQTAHIAGGLCGSFFGFFYKKKKKKGDDL
jgi:membrane associated rhomboid family serine protease